MTDAFAGQCVLITGGGTGLGRETAHRFGAVALASTPAVE